MTMGPLETLVLDQDCNNIAKVVLKRMHSYHRELCCGQVQRNLQLRIEAQGKYLQTILEKAKETLAGHTGASPDLKAAHAELTELASKVISDPSTFAASLPQHLAGLNPPELSNHHASDTTAMQGVINNQVQNMVALPGALPRQQSGRMSDTSSQKSHLTNLTAIHEDSDHSGEGDHRTAPGTNTPIP